MNQKKVRIADVTYKVSWFLTVSMKVSFSVQTTVKHFPVLQRRENSTPALCKGARCEHVQKKTVYMWL